MAMERQRLNRERVSDPRKPSFRVTMAQMSSFTPSLAGGGSTLQGPPATATSTSALCSPTSAILDSAFGSPIAAASVTAGTPGE